MRILFSATTTLSIFPPLHFCFGCMCSLHFCWKLRLCTLLYDIIRKILVCIWSLFHARIYYCCCPCPMHFFALLGLYPMLCKTKNETSTLTSNSFTILYQFFSIVEEESQQLLSKNEHYSGGNDYDDGATTTTILGRTCLFVKKSAVHCLCNVLALLPAQSFCKLFSYSQLLFCFVLFHSLFLTSTYDRQVLMQSNYYLIQSNGVYRSLEV